MMLNVNPAATLWFTSWSGKESNPTCPPSWRFLNFGLLEPAELDPPWFVSLDGAYGNKIMITLVSFREMKMESMTFINFHRAIWVTIWLSYNYEIGHE